MRSYAHKTSPTLHQRIATFSLCVILVLGLCIPCNLSWGEQTAGTNSPAGSSDTLSFTSRATHDSDEAPTRSTATQNLIDKAGQHEGFLSYPISYEKLDALARTAEEAGVTVQTDNQTLTLSSPAILTDALKNITATRDENIKKLQSTTATYQTDLAKSFVYWFFDSSHAWCLA